MKFKQTYIIVFFILIAAHTSLLAQNCSKQKLCDASAYEDFDYKSQTRTAVLAPGDTVRTTVVVYSEQVTRILLCAEDKLGAVSFKLYETVKEVKKYIKKVNKTEEWVDEIKKDASGNTVKDDWGDPVTEEKLVTNYDTIWGRKVVQKEVMIFDSQNNNTGKNFWQKQVKKSKRLIVEAIVPEGDPYIEGCVNLRVGYKAIRRKQFKME